MRTRTFGWMLAAMLVGVCALARPAAVQTCDNGPEAGEWTLPHGSVDGNLDGTLTGSSGTIAYHFTATLHDIPTPCLSCIFGSIDGTLVDVVSGGTTLTVHGFYNGAQLTGSGQFRAQIFAPGATPTSPPVLVGRMRGSFHEPNITQPGTFSGHWVICM